MTQASPIVSVISPASGGYQDTATTAIDAGIGIAPAVAGDVVIVCLDLPMIKQP